MRRRGVRILIVNPYRAAGGGGLAIQGAFHELLASCPSVAGVDAVDVTIDRGALGAFRQARELARGVEPLARAADLLVLQSHFDPGSTEIGRLATRLGVPYVVIPRGDLVPRAAQLLTVRRPLAKRAMWAARGRRLVRDAASLVVSSDLERERLRLVGARTDHARVIPNPRVGAPEGREAPPSDLPATWRAHRPYALWLGRFAPEKGLELLVRAWARVVETCPRALLVLAGPAGRPGERARFLRRRRRLGLDESILLAEPVTGAAKQRLLREARCLLLPSRFESFGNVVLEALDERTPVLVSTETPWEDLPAGLGRWLPRDAGIWAREIASLLTPETKRETDPEERAGYLARFDEARIREAWSRLIEEVTATT